MKKRLLSLQKEANEKLIKIGCSTVFLEPSFLKYGVQGIPHSIIIFWGDRKGLHMPPASELKSIRLTFKQGILFFTSFISALN